MMNAIDHSESGLYRVVHPILASGVPLEAGLAVILPGPEGVKLALAGYLAPLAELPAEGAVALAMLEEQRFDAGDLSEINGALAPRTGNDPAQQSAEGVTSLGTNTSPPAPVAAAPAGAMPAGPEAGQSGSSDTPSADAAPDEAAAGVDSPDAAKSAKPARSANRSKKQ